RAGRPDRPVEEVEPGIFGIGIAVEDVLHRVLADLQRHAVDVALARELTVVALDLLPFTTQADLLAQEQARDVETRVGEVRLLRFAIGVAAGACRIGDTETLQQLGVEVELPALPQPHAEEARDRPGLAALAFRRQAVLSGVEGIDRRIAL